MPRPRIDASATDRGDGGKVVLWSDQTRRPSPARSWRAAARVGGNGGFVETSSKQSSDRRRCGRLGGATRPPRYMAARSSQSDDRQCLPVQVLSLPDRSKPVSSTGDVLVATGTTGLGDGDINVASGVNVSWATNYTLTLSAYRNITLASGAVISNTGAGNLILARRQYQVTQAPLPADVAMFSGGINFSGSTGTVSIYPQSARRLRLSDLSVRLRYPDDDQSVGHQISSRVYMLVNNATESAAIGASPTTLGGTYALGQSFSRHGFGGFATSEPPLPAHSTATAALAPTTHSAT